jgi:hypothetical protein
VRWHILRRARKGKDLEVTKAWAACGEAPGKHRKSRKKKINIPHFFVSDCEENPERLLKNKDNSQNSRKQKRLKYC